MGERNVRVLYVDDDRALGRLVQKALFRQGFDVTHAPSVEDARAALSAGTDVVALDHYLGSGTGQDFLASLIGEPGAPPVVYVTGSTDMNVAVSALKAGAADFVPKTVGEEFLVLLASALRQAVEKATLRAQKEAAEREVRIARDRAEALLAEVNHRVANSLALVASLVNLQAKAVEDQVAKDALAQTQARIYAISLVHKRLYSSGDVRVVDLMEYLGGLLEHIETSLRSEGHRASLSHQLAPIALGKDASVSLGVILTEWITNAFKYAYPSRQGEIRVRLAPLQDGRIELAVEDDGVGRGDDQAANGTGLGTRIVKAMALGIGGEIEYLRRQPGTAARLLFSAPAH